MNLNAAVAEIISIAGRADRTDSQPDPAAELWEARPILRHLHIFARARGVAPLAVLACSMARLVATVPNAIVLPPLVGGYGTLNLFVALVGRSGAGKGAAHAVAAEAIDLSGWRDPISGDELHRIGVGSGEGIVHSMTCPEAGKRV